MATPEIIGVMVGGSGMVMSSGSFSGDRLSRGEFAGLLRGLSPIAMNLALAKYAADKDAERMLIAQYRVEVMGDAIKQGWQIIKGKPTICNLAQYAVYEVISPNRCGKCKGRCFVGNKVCMTCGGTGYRTISGRMIADALGVSEPSYRRHWKQRFELAVSRVQDIDSLVINTLRAADKDYVGAYA
jgi:hypothetical protein